MGSLGSDPHMRRASRCSGVDFKSVPLPWLDQPFSQSRLRGHPPMIPGGSGYIPPLITTLTLLLLLDLLADLGEVAGTGGVVALKR